MTLPIPARYHAELNGSNPMHAWRIIDASGTCVDLVRSPLVAAHDVDLLNAGLAHVDPHGTLGCRVVLNPPTRGEERRLMPPTESSLLSALLGAA